MRPVTRLLLVGALAVTGTLGLATSVSAEVDITAADHCRDMADPVADLYRAFFLREPDEAGLDFWTRWVSNLDGGINEAAEHFARSPEFIDRYGELDAEAFVIQLYDNVLGRSPDAGGLAYWVDALETGAYTRGEAVRIWSISPEFHGVADVGAIPYTPLSFAGPGTEYWCGFGAAQIRVDRLPLDVAQTINVSRSVGPGAYWWEAEPVPAEVSGRADDQTVVVSAGDTLYVHPNLAASILYYQIDIWDEYVPGEDDPEFGQEVPVAWVASSTGFGPPWRTWPEAE